MNSLGRHLLAELYHCEAGLLNDPDQIEQLMNEAARLSGATVVQSVFHTFSPHGVSGVVVVEESHLAVHTWPEHRYAAVDYFSCGEVNSERAVRYLAEHLLPAHVETKEVPRGVIGRRGPSWNAPFGTNGAGKGSAPIGKGAR